MIEISEIELVRQAVAGNRGALESVIRLWGPRVRRFAGRLCPATEVLDAVQETLFVIADRIHTLRLAEALTSWSFQVVKRQCTKAFARVRRDSELVLALGVLGESPHHPDRDLLVAELARVVTELPLRDRQILVLRDIEGLSALQAAASLGVNQRAAKSRLHRARARLKRDVIASPLIKVVLGR